MMSREEMELRLGLLEDALDQLNRTVFRQQQQIDLLQAQLREVYRLTQPADGADGAAAPSDPRAEIPPHY
ncbi:MAG: SlyX protein [Betaproteobacteria bacterium HGW-Betaproteobacteria-11]|nr:MAG: SlyX protein [Betaproteobacteria bacterium HGW-Betaproteobacteria-11]